MSRVEIRYHPTTHLTLDGVREFVAFGPSLANAVAEGAIDVYQAESLALEHGRELSGGLVRFADRSVYALLTQRGYRTIEEAQS